MKVKCSLWTPTGYEQYIFMFSSFFTTKENNVSVITVKKDFLYSQGWLATTTSIRIYIKKKKNEKVYNLFTNVLLFFPPGGSVRFQIGVLMKVYLSEDIF